MQQPGNESKKTQSQYVLNMTMAVVAGQVGCLTLIIIFLALFTGLWLDSVFDTRPMMTVILLVVSVPFTLGGMFWIVRKAISKIKPINQQNQS